MQKIDSTSRSATVRNGVAKARSAARNAMAAPPPALPATGGTDRERRLLEDAAHRFSARRLRDSLPGKIVTRRLVLRAPMRGDVPDLVTLANNRAIAEKLAVLPHPYGVRDALAFIEVFAQSAGQRPYAITLKDRFVGVVGLAFPQGSAPELGYWLGEPHWGQGLISEATRALVDAVWATGHVDRLCAHVLADNAGSRRVLDKLGFVVTGEGPSPHPLSVGRPRLSLELRRPKWM